MFFLFTKFLQKIGDEHNNVGNVCLAILNDFFGEKFQKKKLPNDFSLEKLDIFRASGKVTVLSNFNFEKKKRRRKIRFYCCGFVRDL